ncbi:MAG: hypothetical protein DHS20C12_19920 [Pseudohongiella sp.]|nr:MAG: hypothetical protein DHS20C12_19920 [Pseudohongiella sp.]
MTHTEIQPRVDQLAEQSSESLPSKALLLGGCVNCIDQCNHILGIVSQADYIDDARGSSSIGTHIRHILDRFHCFFLGLPEASIDYDSRKRDPEIEQSIEAALYALESVTKRVERLQQLPFLNESIAVRESALATHPAVEISSTLEREILGLITHSIHHLAIIGLLAKSLGHQVDCDFGKAPSTIAYERA